MTAIGLMRHKLTIEVLNSAPLTAGGQVDDYITLASVWGAIEPLSARSRTLGEFYSHRITIRWRDDVDSYCRVRKGSRVFDVRVVMDPDEQRRVLFLMCDEVRNDVVRA